MVDTNNVLKVENLKINFFTRKGKVYAVDDISFTLKKGETLGLVGESGCGKTTTVLGLMKMVPTPGGIIGGRILIDGEDIIPLSENNMHRFNQNFKSISFRDIKFHYIMNQIRFLKSSSTLITV